MNKINIAIRLIVGLGNPGPVYNYNRHNVGFYALDKLAESMDIRTWKKGFNAAWSDANISHGKIILLKPMTYMNNSGASVLAAASFYKILPEEMLVIHDELDLPLGKLKIKQGGSHGGHNGIKSIESCIGKDFHRLRIGVGHPGNKEQVSSYVLSNFLPQEAITVDKMVAVICANAKHLFASNFDLFMNNAALETNLVK